MIEIQEDAKVLTVKFRGELDQHCADIIRFKIDKAISKTSCKDVVFDFTDLTFTDSTGIGLILGRYKILKNRNITLSIKNPNSLVNKVLNATGIYSIINVIE